MRAASSPLRSSIITYGLLLMPKDTVLPTARARTSYRQAPGSPDPLLRPWSISLHGTSSCQCQALSELLVQVSHGDDELPSIALGARLQAPGESPGTEHPNTHSQGRAVGCGHQCLPRGCWLCRGAAELLEPRMALTC